MSGPVGSYRPGGSYEHHSSSDRGRGNQAYRGQGRGRGGYQQREYQYEQRGNDWEQDVRERQPDRRHQRDPYDSRQHSRNHQTHQSFDMSYDSASTSGSAMRVPAAPLHPSLPARPGGPTPYERQQPQREEAEEARSTPPNDWYAEHSEAAAAPAATNELPQKPRKKIVTPPNQSVILIGIPLPATEEDVKSFIDEFKANAEDPSPVDNVSIVRDKQTGQSKRFGFVRFISLEHARAFVEANFDHVYWRSRGSHDITEDGVKVRLDYATVDRRPGETPRDAKNAPPRESYQPPAFRLNDGSKDMGSSPNRILLLRNLDPLTKEYDITRSLEHLDEDMQERVKNAQGPRRVILIKDKETHSSWCFAFALYEDEECAKAAMRTIMDPARFPTGYSIHQRLIAVTFARIGCFAQAYAKTTWSFSDDTLEGKKQEYMYWDDAAYANVYDCANYQGAAKRKQEEAAKENEVDAFFSSLESEHPAPKAETVQAPPKIDLNTAGLLGPPGGFTKDKRKGATELIISKKIAVDINKWNQKKAEPEMAAFTEPASEAQSTAATSAMKRPNPSETEEARQGGFTAIATSSEAFPYADTTDPKLPKCLLCQRQFKSIEVLRKHNDQSSLHKTNLEDQAKVDAARAAVAELAPAESASQYRDRALERRETYNQPEHPPPPPSKKHKKAPETKPVSSAPEKHIEESNIGSKLLASMGWTAGAGLGSSQAGRADPIQAKAFVQGAGIGASKGINASEQAGDSWGRSEHGRNKARQRMLEEQRQAP